MRANERKRNRINPLAAGCGALCLAVLLLATFVPHSTAASALALLRVLEVNPETNAGYDRDRFADWIDDDLDDCDTRQEVLLRQNRAEQKSCNNERGLWFSAYDGETVRSASELDVDHLVPLAEAWGSGARRWTDSQRDAFSNDLYRRSLLAVSASSNRSKSDQDPNEWLPPRKSFRCRYVALWTATKFRWSLSVDFVEKRALKQTMGSCGSNRLNLGKIKKVRTQ